MNPMVWSSGNASVAASRHRCKANKEALDAYNANMRLMASSAMRVVASDASV